LKLSQELGVSRAPVREALREIASQGLMEMVAGFGAYLRVPDKQELADIFACREALEAKASELSARQITPAQIAALHHSLSLVEALCARIATQGLTEMDEAGSMTLLEADLEFHRTIIHAAKNAPLARMLTQMHLMQRTWAQRLDPLRFPLAKSLQSTLREHKAVVRALELRDGSLAGRAMARHIRASARRFLRQHNQDNLQRLCHPSRVARLLVDLDFEAE
jgi:DNA-binding GntR family transcriptional regulator